MRKILHIIPFICLCIFPVVGEDSEKAATVEFIKTMVQEALGIVNGNGEDHEKCKKLSECINKYLDLDGITKFVFSPKGYTRLPTADQKKVIGFMTDHLLCYFASPGKLAAMVGAKLVDVVATPENEGFAVTTKFAKNGSLNPTEIVWKVNKSKVDKLMITDVEIEMISQKITERSNMNAAVGSGTLMEYIDKQSAK